MRFSKQQIRVTIVLLLLAVGSGVGIYQYRKKKKAAAIAASKPKDKRSKDEMAIARESKERRAVNDFANDLRKLFQWKNTQNVSDSVARKNVIKTLATKMEAIPFKQLPKSDAMAWKEMLECWRALVAVEEPDEALQKRGEAAAAKLNAALKAEGYGDLRF